MVGHICHLKKLDCYVLIPKSIIFEATDDIQFREILNQTLELKGLKYIRTIRKAPEAVYQGGEDFSKGLH